MSQIMEVSEDLEHLFKEKGLVITVPMSKRFFLHQKNALIYLDKGNFDLYSFKPLATSQENTYLTDNQSFTGDLVKGHSTFLSHIEPNNLIFPFPILAESLETELVMGLANSEVTLYVLSLDHLDVEAYAHNLTQQIKKWLNYFAPFFKPHHLLESTYYAPLSSPITLQPDETLILAHEAEIKDLHSVVWVKIDGEITYFGVPQLAISSSKLIPITINVWLSCRNPVIIHPLIQHLPILDQINGLYCFHQIILKLITYQHLQKESKSIELSKERKLQDVQLLDDTVRSLLTVLLDEAEDLVSAKNDKKVLRACQIVGAQNKVAILPSQKTLNDSIQEELKGIAAASNIYFRQVLLTKNWWKRDQGALLGFEVSSAEENPIPVALIPSESTYKKISPENDAKVSIINESDASKIHPFAQMFYRALPNKETISGLDVLKFCAQGRQVELVIIAMIMMLTMMLAIFNPIANQLLFDYAIPNLDWGMFLTIICGLFVIDVVVFLISITEFYTNLRMNTLIDHDLQVGIWGRLLDLPANFFRKYTIGNLMQRVSAVGMIRRLIGTQGLGVIVSVITGFSYFIVMLYYSPLLTIVGFGILILGAIITAVFFLINRNYELKQMDLEGELNGDIVHIIFGLSKIRTNGAENRIFSYWAKSCLQIQKIGLKVGWNQNFVHAFNIVLSSVLTLSIYLIVIQMIQGTAGVSTMTLGGFMAFNAAFSMFSGSFFSLSGTAMEFVAMMSIWKRGKVILDQPPESLKGRTYPGILAGEVRLENIKFKYDTNGVDIHDDVSIHAAPGEFVAIVGPSGSGKSTLIRLLLGFETPYKGAVTYDGKDLNTLDLKAVRSQLGVILQGSSLMDGSIRENVTGGSSATDEEVIAALEKAGFREVLDDLPMGIRTVITTGGSTLSSGQRQRIMIARAILNPTKILLLDEATNALDNKAQEIVLQNLDKMNTTRIVIAHRLSTIVNADRIYVMEKGKVIDVGTYKELSVKEGLFKDLLEKQKL